MDFYLCVRKDTVIKIYTEALAIQNFISYVCLLQSATD